ncbi:KR domain-containing protein [Annulohypoxylon nitens]|nr:KR domain-containing protein [Annulohypoxylon nitens]
MIIHRNMTDACDHRESITTLPVKNAGPQSHMNPSYEQHGYSRVASLGSEPQITEAAAPLLPNPRQFCMHVDCKVALDKLDNKGTFNLLEKLHPDAGEPLDFFQDLELLVEASIQRLIDSFDFTTLSQQEHWKQKYIEWATFHLEHSRSKCQWGNPDSPIENICRSFEETCDRLRQTNHTSRLWVTVASNLIELFNGDTAILELLDENDLLENYYQEIATTYRCSSQISTYIDLLAHQNPAMKILELGGGIGEGTRMFVKSLYARPNDPGGILRCSRYDVTDISVGSFDFAKLEFRKHGSQIKFGTLDIEKDFADQGFPEGQYDVVFAMSALHISTDLSKTLQHVRKALKPGGKLIFQEPFDPNGWIYGFVFGLFPEWWMGENDNRRLSPVVNIDTWNTVLIENGFSGVDILLEFGKNVACHEGWIISSAIDTTPIPKEIQLGQHMMVIIDKTCASQTSLANTLAYSLLNSSGVELNIMSFEAAMAGHLRQARDSVIINLVDYGQSFISQLNNTKWQYLKALIDKSRRLLWVSSGGGHDPMPDYGLLDGLARTLRSERNELHLVTLALEPPNSSELKVSHVTQILKEMVNRVAHQNYEQEYIEMEGLLHTRRLVEARYLKLAIDQSFLSHRRTKKHVEEKGKFNRIHNSREQDVNTINFNDDDLFGITTAVPPGLMLDSNASYLIANGLEGLGREIVRWLVSRGARYLILLSRSGPQTDTASHLVTELEGRGVYVEKPCCDISDSATLKSVLTSCSEKMPPIKGCVQASMVMAKDTFEQVQLSDWKAVIDPKVKGSWNLHAECPKGLDFFVLISSATGIFGTESLAAYNVGSTYQDALARYRLSQGERAVSFDLGSVADAGYTAEGEHTSTIFQRQDKLEALQLPEIFTLLDICCNPIIPLTHLYQSIVGIKQPSLWKSGEDEPFTMRQPFWGHMHQIASLAREN